MEDEECPKNGCGRCMWCEYEAGDNICPKCSSRLEYDNLIDGLKCPSCGFAEE